MYYIPSNYFVHQSGVESCATKMPKKNYDSGFHDETDSFLWQRLGSSAEESIAAGGQLCFNDNDFNDFTLDLSPKTKL